MKGEQTEQGSVGRKGRRADIGDREEKAKELEA